MEGGGVPKLQRGGGALVPRASGARSVREEAFCPDGWHLVRSHDHGTFEQRRTVPLAVKLACCNPFSRQHTASKGEYLSISLWQRTANYVKELAWGVIPLAVASSFPN